MRMLRKSIAALVAAALLLLLAPAALATGGVVTEDGAGTPPAQGNTGGVVGSVPAVNVNETAQAIKDALRAMTAEPAAYTVSGSFSYTIPSLYGAYNLPYVIGVDVTNQVITVVAKGEGGVYDQIVRQFICSTGTVKDPTPIGTHTLSEGERKDWAYFKTFKCYVRYPVRIYGNYFFHSLLYSKQDVSSLKSSSLKNLGTRASHGCIRMLDDQVQWISENCLPGTIVEVYEGAPNEALRLSLLP